MFDLPPHRPSREPGPAPEPAGLDAVSPAWAPVVARDGRPIGFRLALRQAPGAPPPVNLAALLAGVLAGFESDAGTSFPHGLVIIASLDQAADESLRTLSAPRNVIVEVGQCELDDEDRLALLVDLQRHGLRLALRLDSPAAVARERLPLFQYVVADAAHQAALPREAALLVTHVDCRATAEAAFRHGANAVIGWPLHEGVVARQRELQPTQRAVLDLIRRVQADADVVDLERAFRRDPMLSYLLLTLANSPAFIRATPISSLSQAITLLGYRRLVKWLVLLLVIASKESKTLPYMYAAVARGLLMENLAAAAGVRGSFRDDCFVIGAFSLLDKITGQSLQRLLGEIELPGPIKDALLAGLGAYAPYLALTLALEAGDMEAVGAHAQQLHLPLADVNAALLQALAATDALQSVV